MSKARVTGIRTMLALSLLALGSACSGDEPTVTLAGETYTVAIADDDAERARGLMFVEQMPADHGMLFLFPDERPRSFWMKNTLIPLDIIYFDSDRTIVSISKNARPCRTANCARYPSEAPARYVLELNAGEADRLGLEPGVVMELNLDPGR